MRTANHERSNVTPTIYRLGLVVMACTPLVPVMRFAQAVMFVSSAA